MKKIYVEIDAATKTLLMTKKAYNATKKGYGPEYEELCAKMEKHPSFNVVIKEQNSHLQGRNKRTYKGMNEDFIKEYIMIQEIAEISAEYESIKKYANDNGKKEFAFVKMWFLAKFATKEKPFDFETAQEEIKEYHLRKAEMAA